MRLVEVADGLFRAARRGINVYLLVKEHEAILFDTGDPSFAKALVSAVSPFPPVRAIFLTHCHYDHAGSAAELSESFQTDVFAQAEDAALLREGTWRRPSKPSPTVLGHLLTHLVANRYPDRIQAVQTVQTIDLAEERLARGINVTPLPGHCAGQVGYSVTLSFGQRAWIVGDVVMTIAGLREPILFEDRRLG